MAVDLLEKWGTLRERTPYTKELLTEQLFAKAQALGRAPKLAEVNDDPDMASTMAFYGVFETASWNTVLEEAGLTVNTRREIPISELKAQLQAKAEKEGHPPSSTEVRNDPDMASSTTFTNAFGGMPWKTMLKYLGLAEGPYTADELTSVLNFMTKTLGRTPKSREVTADPNVPPASVIIKTFGVKRWDEVIIAAGLSVNTDQSSRGAHTPESLKEQFLAKAETLGRPPSQQEVNDDSEMASVATYRRHFGKDWNGMVTAFDLKINPIGFKKIVHTEASLKEQFLRKAEALGGTPSEKDVNDDPDMASVATYKRVFRTSWSKIGEGFGLAPNKQGGKLRDPSSES